MLNVLIKLYLIRFGDISSHISSRLVVFYHLGVNIATPLCPVLVLVYDRQKEANWKGRRNETTRPPQKKVQEQKKEHQQKEQTKT